MHGSFLLDLVALKLLEAVGNILLQLFSVHFDLAGFFLDFIDFIFGLVQSLLAQVLFLLESQFFLQLFVGSTAAIREGLDQVN